MIKEKEEQIEEYRNVLESNKRLIKEYEAKEEMLRNNNTIGRQEKEKEKEYQKTKKDLEKMKKQFEELKYEYDVLLK